MRRADFHFDLPKGLIAQQPVPERSASRLLALDGATGVHRDLVFRDLAALLRPDDLLVFNDTKVVPARVHGTKETGGRIEIMLERAVDPRTALVQARASKGLKAGAQVSLPGGATARMLGREGDLYRLRFSCDVLPYFDAHGEIPLPPYVERPPDAADRERYQTVYARAPGAVAAPTAGLHFDAATFAALAEARVRCAFVTLHVGAGTFQPVRVEELAQHVMHEEYLEVNEKTAAAINATRDAGGRVIAVGTTVVRCLETAMRAAETAQGARDARDARGARGAERADGGGRAGGADGGGRAGGAGGADGVGAGGAGAGALPPAIKGATMAPFTGATRMFITPGYRFRAVDAMITNFHLPESTLLMLCAAFVGRERLFAAYAHAIAAQYRFFSYGDAMFLTPCHPASGHAP